jgi:alkylation response protein AidB-like acyl-CoA dehydrogenase
MSDADLYVALERVLRDGRETLSQLDRLQRLFAEMATGIAALCSMVEETITEFSAAEAVAAAAHGWPGYTGPRDVPFFAEPAP